MKRFDKRIPGASILVICLLCAPHAQARQTRVDYHVRLTPENSAIGNYPIQKAPILTVKSGATVKIDTGGGAGWRRDKIDPNEWLKANGIPLTASDPAISETIAVLDKTQRYADIDSGHLLIGPINVEDAMPGDSIEVRILSVEPRIPYGSTGVTQGRSLRVVEEGKRPPSKITTMDLKRKVALFRPGIEVPLGPFMGVMALQPADIEGPNRRSGPPGLFAGNLDLKELTAGSTLHIPVFHPGGRFFTGDAHAVQGDGEITGTAIETANTLVVQFILHKGRTLKAPRVETPTHWIALGLDPDLDNAMQMAVDETVSYLKDVQGLDEVSALPLSSIGVDFSITQVVDGTKGIHAKIPKSYFIKAKNDYWYRP